jgi:multidrug resistance efflux pump
MLNISDSNNSELKEIPVKGFHSFRLVGTPRAGKILAYWLTGIFIILLLSLLMPWTQNIRTKGQVTAFSPEDRPQTIHSTIPGRIEKWYVMEGQYVNKGDTIVQLSEIKDAFFNPEMLDRLAEQIESKENALLATRDKVVSQESQIAALKDGLQLSLSKARNKVEQSILKVQSDSMDMSAARLDQDVARQQYQRQQQLFDQGLKSLTELEQRRVRLQDATAKLISAENKYMAARNELANSRIELNSLQADYADKISKAESDLNSTRAYIYDNEAALARLRNDYRNMQIRSGFYFITAPQSGTLVQALRVGLGETIKEGEALISIIPENTELAVELFVRAMDIPLLARGQKVRLQFDGWPALVFSGWPDSSFGTFGGIVKVIDRVGTGGSFRILVVPDPSDIAWPGILGVGSGVYGWALLNNVPIGYELWRQFNGFPPDLVSDENLKQNIPDYSHK